MVLSEGVVYVRVAVRRELLQAYFAACEAQGMTESQARAYLRRLLEIGLGVGAEEVGRVSARVQRGIRRKVLTTRGNVR